MQAVKSSGNTFHQSKITCLDWAPDSRRLATGGMSVSVSVSVPVSVSVSISVSVSVSVSVFVSAFVAWRFQVRSVCSTTRFFLYAKTVNVCISLAFSARSLARTHA